MSYTDRKIIIVSICTDVTGYRVELYFGKRSQVPFYILCIVFIFLTSSAQITLAADGGNCLMCHKMPGFGIYERESGGGLSRRLFYIDEKLYENSYHGRLDCLGCHSDINQVPHENVSKVNCANECHIKDPSSNKMYSHKNITNDLNNSAHGVKDDHPDDYPGCKYCHTNKAYQSDTYGSENKEEFIAICLQCHDSAEWVERFFKHINYRIRIRRSSKDIVSLCSQCHADGAMMGRHRLDVVVGFNDTFHGKAIKYGNTKVANCLNCHATYSSGFSPHSIISQTNSKSPVSPINKLQTCRQSGCHIDAKDVFASKGKVHPSSYGLISWMRPNLTKSSDNSAGDAQTQIVYLINLFYKILIAVVVGGLCVHQLLNLRAIKRDAHKERVQ